MCCLNDGDNPALSLGAFSLTITERDRRSRVKRGRVRNIPKLRDRLERTELCLDVFGYSGLKPGVRLNSVSVTTD